VPANRKAIDVFLAQDDAAGEGSLLFPLLMIAGLFAIFYFLMIRPQRRRREATLRVQSQLAVGDEVMTSSGLYGTVAELDDKTVILETSDGVFSRYLRGAVIEVVSRADDSSDSDTAVEHRDSKD
jgi:preprotein translocase subunit YajC